MTDTPANLGLRTFWLTLGAVALAVVLFYTGEAFGRAQSHAELPNCAEDEYYYVPIRRATLKPSDLACIHVDQIP